MNTLNHISVSFIKRKRKLNKILKNMLGKENKMAAFIATKIATVSQYGVGWLILTFQMFCEIYLLFQSNSHIFQSFWFTNFSFTSSFHLSSFNIICLHCLVAIFMLLYRLFYAFFHYSTCLFVLFICLAVFQSVCLSVLLGFHYFLSCPLSVCPFFQSIFYISA